MNFTSEQIKKARNAKSAEELLAMAKAENYPMTEDEAQKIFAELHKQGELTDEELMKVAGGGKYDPPQKFFVNDVVGYTTPTPAKIGVVFDAYLNAYNKWMYRVKFDDGSHIDVSATSLSLISR